VAVFFCILAACEKGCFFEKQLLFYSEIKEDCQLNFDMFSMYYYIGNTFNDMY